MLRWTSTISKFRTEMDSIPTSLTFPTNSRGTSLNRKKFRNARGTTAINFLMNLWKRFCLTIITTRKKKLGRPEGFVLCGKLGVDFFSSCGLLYSNLNIRLRLIRARPVFYMISDNPNVSHGFVHCSLYIRRNALRDDYHRKRKDMLV